MTSFIKVMRKCIWVSFLCFILGALVILYYLEFQLPDTKALNTVQFQVPLQIFSSEGKLIAEYGEKRRIPLPYDQIPKQLINAVLATEDQRYFVHPGIDISGLIRASIQLILTHRKEQGGSTITMQVARSFYLDSHKTFHRKIREILLALKIDHTLSKQKILELYLNKIFLGNRAYGVAAAAELYYGKPLNELTLDQYALLAGLPKAPSTLNPLVNPKAARKRRDHVLARLYEQHYIKAAEYKEALKAPVIASYHETAVQVKAPFVGELVRQQLEEMYGDSIYTDGFKVYTTIDSQLQNAANEAVQNDLIAYDQRHGYRGPLKNLGKPNLKNMKKWENILNNIPVMADLEPAAVVDMTENSLTALRANGSLITIPWKGLAWARRQINADFLGRIPTRASDIARLGDVIRIMFTNEGWRLSQIPKAEAGLVTLDPSNGKIIALVGGFDFQSSKFNRITKALRQPGSSFKPFIYSAALDKGFTLATLVDDAPIEIENPNDNSIWRPQNDEHRSFGPTRLRDALIHSRNLVSIRLLSLIGAPYAVKFAERFGFSKSQLPAELSLALGTASVTPLEMATGYAVFANGGYKIAPFAIDTIRNTQGNIIYQAKPLVACATCDITKMNADNTQAPRVISAQNAFLITSALHDVIQEGTAMEARSLQRSDVAGKTGTTNNQVDAWFAGYNPDFVTVTWVGFDQQQQSLHEYGKQAALPIWIDFMEQALKGHPEHPLEIPPGIISIKIDPQTGKRSAATTAKLEYFMQPYLPDDDSAPQEAEGNQEEKGDLY